MKSFYREVEMIPKIIHYCWFGRGEKSKLAIKCIESWKRICPEYKIIEWNEDNFKCDSLEYTRFTYDHKLYAYLSDYVRLWAVFTYGGLYFDTDVQLIKTPQDLLLNKAFLGFESREFVNTGLGFGSEKNNEDIHAMMGKYEELTYDECAKMYQAKKCLTGSPKMNTYALTPYGLIQNGKEQVVNSIKVFPIEFFCPFNDVTGELNITDNTFSIHWYSKSVQGKFEYYKSKVVRPLKRVLRMLGIRYTDLQ